LPKVPKVPKFSNAVKLKEFLNWYFSNEPPKKT
jgi:hypothetical protein